MRAVSGALMSTTFEKTSTFITDVFSLQLSVKYFFN
jgi:hypothetical protein